MEKHVKDSFYHQLQVSKDSQRDICSGSCYLPPRNACSICFTHASSCQVYTYCNLQAECQGYTDNNTLAGCQGYSDLIHKLSVMADMRKGANLVCRYYLGKTVDNRSKAVHKPQFC